MELPKFIVPTFDGDIYCMDWAVFLEQFETAIHNSKKLHEIAQQLGTQWKRTGEDGNSRLITFGRYLSGGSKMSSAKI